MRAPDSLSTIESALYIVRSMTTDIVIYGGYDHRPNHHCPVCHRYIYLSVEFIACMYRFDVREVRSLHYLREQLEGTGYESLRCNNSCEDRNYE